MKFVAPLALGALASTAIAVVIPQVPLLPSVVKNEQQTRWLIELAPYETRWVTEEEKWALKLVSRLRSGSWFTVSTNTHAIGRCQLH